MVKLGQKDTLQCMGYSLYYTTQAALFPTLALRLDAMHKIPSVLPRLLAVTVCGGFDSHLLLTIWGHEFAALRGSTVSYAGDAHFAKHSLEYSLNFWSQPKRKKRQFGGMSLHPPACVHIGS